MKPLPVDCHSVKVPLSLRNNRSALPSPLKSPVPRICHVGSTVELTTTLGVKPLPVDCHSVKVPLLLRQSRSAVPSPLKSAAAARCQVLSTPPMKTFGVNP